MTLRLTYGPWGETLAELRQAARDAEGAGAQVLWLPEMHRRATITAAAEEQATAAQEISASVQHASVSVADVTGSVTDVSGAAEETGRSASELLSAAQRLEESTNKLSSRVEDFTHGLKA